MNSRFIIIAILIFIKVIGVASRARADFDVLACVDYSLINYKTSKITSNNPIYRCGNRKIYKDV